MDYGKGLEKRDTENDEISRLVEKEMVSFFIRTWRFFCVLP
jgi:hypothetical protein